MKHLTTIVCLFLGFNLIAQSDIEKSLFLLEDVIFKSIDAPKGYEAAYELMVKQPLDHKNPDRGHFYQRVFLSHLGFDAPSVLITEGYNRPTNRVYELSRFLSANQLDVEHRYYGASMPDSLDYRYLNLEQATADLHRINRLFRTIYNGPFVTTGISKGGMTTLFYRYFYPDDVEASVPYVAPINVDFKDKRIYKFLDNVGDKACREKVENFQRHLLKNKSEYLPLVKWYSKGQNNSFERLTVEGAYELAVLEYSFSFWQFGVPCDNIPALTEDREKILDHFLSVSGVAFFSDKSITDFGPFYYQMGHEMGYYGYNTDDFKEYITVVGDEPSAVFRPENVSTTFDPTFTRKAQKWMTTELERVVYINGANDTWSATAIQPKKKLDAVVFNLAGQSHGSARIKNMTAEEKALLESTLERWLKIDIQPME